MTQPLALSLLVILAVVVVIFHKLGDPTCPEEICGSRVWKAAWDSAVVNVGTEDEVV